MRDEEESCPRCNKCDRWRAAPDYMQDPWVLWERFPCPPPDTNRTRLLLELDWTGHMGSKDGCRALERVSTRCKLDLTQVKVIPSSLINCDNLFKPLVICGTQCVVAIILACICFLFVILLAIVCYRYVRRNEHKQSSPTCVKVPASDQTALKPHINRYYVHSQYYYRAGNIPQRRCLPVEVKTTENGVEARLIRAIQVSPRPNYPFEELCSQCMNGSKQNIFGDPRVRQGYERIYWKDKDCLQKRVPSNDSLHRKPVERHRSTTGSSSDTSHYYDYIGDAVYDSSTGRRSNHSMIYGPRNSSLNFKEAHTPGELRHSDDDRGFIYPRIPVLDLDYRDTARQERVPSRTSVDMRFGTINDRNIYQGSLSDHYNCLDNTLEHRNRNSSLSSNEMSSRHRHPAESSPRSIDHAEPMKGYKYTINPFFDEETTTASVKDDLSTSPETPSECIEFDNLASNQRYSRENCLVPSPNYNRARAKSRTPSLRSTSNNNSEKMSFSDYPTNSNNIQVPLTNGAFYKANGSKSYL